MKKFDKDKLLKESKTFCMAPWIELHILNTGKVYPCCASDNVQVDGLGDLSKGDTLLDAWNSKITGSNAFYDDYEIDEEIHHLDGQTIEEAEHQLATRLYQNNARVHFNQHVEKEGRFGKRIIYGGYIISLARAISCNGFANSIKIAAIHSGTHSAPTFSGDTIYAWSKVLEKKELDKEIGALKIRTLASKNNSKIIFPDEKLPENIVLDIIYSILIPIK